MGKHSIKQSALLAFLGFFLGSTVATVTLSEEKLLPWDMAPTPGAMSLSLNSTSINNIMQTFVPILSYFALNNQTFDLNLTTSGFGYSMSLDSIHVVTVSGFTTKIFENYNNTDQLHVRIGGIDASVDVNGELDALYFIPLRASHVNVTNATIDFTVQATSDDKVHWQIVDKAVLTVDNVVIDMENSYLDWLVKKLGSTVNAIIKDLLPMVGKAVDAQIEKLNEMVTNEGPYTFVVNTLGKEFPLNLTMTAAPHVGGDLIQVYFDGLFDVPQNVTSNTDFAVEQNNEWPVRFEHAHSEQVFIHESTFNSLLNVADDSFFPYNITNMTSTIMETFPSIQAYYGENATVVISMSMVPSSDKSPITFSEKDGIVIGDEENLITRVRFICSNETTADEEAVFVAMNLETHANVTMDNLIFYPIVEDILVENTKVKKDIVGIQLDNLDEKFTKLLQTQADSFNTEWEKGWAIANLNPQFAMLGGLIKNSTLTPYVYDGWIYGGFSMQADLPTLQFIQ